jgi:hypothetical protein
MHTSHFDNIVVVDNAAVNHPECEMHMQTRIIDLGKMDPERQKTDPGPVAGIGPGQKAMSLQKVEPGLLFIDHTRGGWGEEVDTQTRF